MRLGGDPEIVSSDFGISMYGNNADVDAAEDVWTVGGDFDWSKVAANATTTIESSSAADDGNPGGTGARTVEVEGLVETTINGVTGGKIVRETVTLNGTGAVTLVNPFMFVYKVDVESAGSGHTNAGLISVKHGADTIATIAIGASVSEMALMIVPHFTSMGTRIQAAYLHSWYAGTVITTAADINFALLCTHENDLVWHILRRGVATIYNDINQSVHLPFYLPAGAKVRIRASAVSAANQNVAACFELEYSLG